MKQKVSVIVPVYNCEKYVEECIMSIIKQTYTNIEIIVVNDGSSDKSDEIIRELATKYSQIKYFYKDNEGVAIARNYGIQNSTGEYLLFVDSDDYVEENYIEKLIDCAQKNKSDMVISGYTMLFQNDLSIKKTVPGTYKKNEKEEWAYRISSTMSHLYDKSFWDKYDISFVSEKNARAEDVPVVLFANIMAKNIEVCLSSGYIYRQHEQSAMNNKIKKVKFTFPYNTFKDMYEKVKLQNQENSKAFFNFGVLKFLAHFEFVLYRYADKVEKAKFSQYIIGLLGEDFNSIVNDWSSIKKHIDLPIVHKIAIELFVLKYRKHFREMK